MKFFSFLKFLRAFGLLASFAMLASCSAGIERFAAQGAGGLLGNNDVGGGSVFRDSAANLPVPSQVTSGDLEPVTGETGGLVVEPPAAPAVIAPPPPPPQPVAPQPQQVATATSQVATATSNDDYLQVPEQSQSESAVLPNTVPLPKPSPRRSFQQTSQATQPAQPTQPAQQQQVATATATSAPADISILRWPVKGKVISNFGEVQDGIDNDGIDISVPVGTPVKAAEGGLVIYASNELKEFGNLILITHDGGLVTAYAYNEKNNVKKGDKVKRGDVIAVSGTSGNAKSPRLHFQVRKDKKPVDPKLYLSTN